MSPHQHRLRLVGSDPIDQQGGLFSTLPRVEGRLLSGKELGAMVDTMVRGIRDGIQSAERSNGSDRAAVIYRTVAASLDGVVDQTIPVNREIKAVIEQLSTSLHAAYFAVNRSEHGVELKFPNGGRGLSREQIRAITSDLGFEYHGMLEAGLDLLKVLDQKFAQDPVRSRSVAATAERFQACLEKYRNRQF